MSDPKYYTAQEVADLFGISEWTVKRWCKRGEMEGAFRIKGPVGWRIPANAVDRKAAQLAAGMIVQEAAADAAAY